MDGIRLVEFDHLCEAVKDEVGRFTVLRHGDAQDGRTHRARKVLCIRRDEGRLLEDERRRNRRERVDHMSSRDRHLGTVAHEVVRPRARGVRRHADRAGFVRGHVPSRQHRHRIPAAQSFPPADKTVFRVGEKGIELQFAERADERREGRVPGTRIEVAGDESVALLAVGRVETRPAQVVPDVVDGPVRPREQDLLPHADGHGVLRAVHGREGGLVRVPRLADAVLLHELEQCADVLRVGPEGAVQVDRIGIVRVARLGHHAPLEVLVETRMLRFDGRGPAVGDARHVRTAGVQAGVCLALHGDALVDGQRLRIGEVPLVADFVVGDAPAVAGGEPFAERAVDAGTARDAAGTAQLLRLGRLLFRSARPVRAAVDDRIDGYPVRLQLAEQHVAPLPVVHALLRTDRRERAHVAPHELRAHGDERVLRERAVLLRVAGDVVVDAEAERAVRPGGRHRARLDHGEARLGTRLGSVIRRDLARHAPDAHGGERRNGQLQRLSRADGVVHGDVRSMSEVVAHA